MDNSSDRRIEEFRKLKPAIEVDKEGLALDWEAVLKRYDKIITVKR